MPAAAVKQEEQALFVVIGRKGYVGGCLVIFIKFWSSYFRACKFEGIGLSYV